MDGGEGIDDLWYTGSAVGVNVNLTTGEAFGGDAQGDEFVNFERLWGSGQGDTLTGSAGDNTINGAGGNDLVAGGGGRDLVRGGDGNDTVEGGAGRDILIGEAGNDVFRFRALTESGTTAPTRDVIRGFTQGQDVIDLSLIDAHTGVAGDQAFAFRDVLPFSGTAPEVRYAHVNGNTLVTMDANGDTSVDMSLLLQGIHVLQATDFML
jgi:Ca2+-binding RTX toxin-like protein